MTNLLGKIQKACQEKRLVSAVYSQAKPYISGLQYLFHDPASDRVVLHCPNYVAPSQDKSELAVVERIFRAFRKMKNDQQKVASCYLPSSLWQEQLDQSYAHLTSGLKADDIRPFHFFLANFGTWKAYHGLESNMVIRDNMTSLIRRRYLKNVMFYKQLKTWEWFYNARKSLSCLTYPMYGNQAGAYIDGIFVGLGSFFSEIYGSLLNGLISKNEHPIVADLGGGYGKLAYFTLRHQERFTFIDFDLPETLCLAAYYLMKVWPEKKVLLYGEEEYTPETHGRYDLIFMPSYEIAKVGRSTVDLFINKNSLGEMAKDAVKNYVGYITKATRYFFHMNHDIHANMYSNNDRGLLGYEYPIPLDEFKLLFRYPDVNHMLCYGGVDFRMDIFIYLYERRDDQGVVSRDRTNAAIESCQA